MSGIKIAPANSQSFQNGAFSFISCTSGRDSLPQDENEPSQPMKHKTESKKKKFHPLRNLRRMFRRKARRSSISADSYQAVVERPEVSSAGLEQRSCSTSRLQEDNSTISNYMGSNSKSSRLNPGLSLSHDSIFTPERADSGLSSSDLGNSSLSITILTPPSRECATKSQQSSCSETSLLSIGSSEVEELSPIRNKNLSDLDVGVSSYKLNHSAAKHKMAVRPKRNHGAPRNRRTPMTSKSPLPTTIEVNEEKMTGQNSPSADRKWFFSSGLNCRPPETESKTASLTFIKSFGKLEDGPQIGQSVKDLKDPDSNHRTESFFGRFLSKRSEKKKKCSLASDDGMVGDRSNSLGRRSGKSGRSQKIEPANTLSNAVLSIQIESKKEEENVSNSLSPESCFWPVHLTPTSVSSRKDNFSFAEEIEKRDGSIQAPPTWNDFKSMEGSPLKKPSSDLKNRSFVEELTNSVSLFAKDEFGKRRKEKEGNSNETDIEMIPEDVKIRMQNSSVEISGKSVISVGNRSLKPNPTYFLEEESTSADIEVFKSSSLSESDGANFFDDCREVKMNEWIDPALENIERKYEQPFDETGKPHLKPEISPTTTSEGVLSVTMSVESFNVMENNPTIERIAFKTTEEKLAQTCKDKTNETVKKIKPVVSQKPKNLKRIGTSGLMKVPKTPTGETDIKRETKAPSANQVDQNESEAMLTTVTSEEDWTPTALESNLKNPSLVEEVNLLSMTSSLKSASPEITDEVVFRKRSHSGFPEDQPELMKVFARRSLKVRETEKINEDLQRSRDSDKENEKIDSPKEERKKSCCEIEDITMDERSREGSRNSMPMATTSIKIKYNNATTAATTENGTTLSLTSMKPKSTTNKNLPHRYGRSLSENNARPEEVEIRPGTLEEDKIKREGKRITEVGEYYVMLKGENEESEEDEEKQNQNVVASGFKRIQQRKAEWERRAQKSTK